MQKEMLSEEKTNKWNKLIDECRGVAKIEDVQQKNTLVRLLENTVNALAEETAGSSTTQSSISGFDPILINMVRRSQPALVANQLVGVQPMTGPTGLIFAMKANTQKGAKGSAPGTLKTDVWAGEADETLTRMQSAEALGTNSSVDGDASGATGTYQVTPWPEMGFSIEKQTVTAYTRALKARYTTELAQDLKAIHNLDAEAILADMLSAEIVAEQDREIIGLINSMAKPAKFTAGAGQIALPSGVVGTTDGVVDFTQAGFDGRWSTEIYSQVLTLIEKMANRIAIDTRRGRGNIIICSPNVATAIEAAGSLMSGAGTSAFASSNISAPDVTGVTFLGVLNNRYKVYMDPYASEEYVTVGYRGANAYDAGLFMAPYVPLQFHKATGEEDFQPRLGFKTRYGVAVNPFVTGAVAFNADANGAGRTAVDQANDYYQRATLPGI